MFPGKVYFLPIIDKFVYERNSFTLNLLDFVLHYVIHTSEHIVTLAIIDQLLVLKGGGSDIKLIRKKRLP